VFIFSHIPKFSALNEFREEVSDPDRNDSGCGVKALPSRR
jgi:hypothetical protein